MYSSVYSWNFFVSVDIIAQQNFIQSVCDVMNFH